MFEKLKLLGEVAEYHWRTNNTSSEDYRKVHKAVEEEIAFLRAEYPSKFWNDGDPDYKVLTTIWTEKRKQREEERKAAIREALK